MKTHLLAEHGKTAWRIVMAHPAHETVKLACDELFHFVMQMSGAALPVQTELVADGEYEILVGNSGRLAHHGIHVDWDELGEEGFVMQSAEHYLLLAGATPRGTLYAVYAFLEEELGCRWFASDCARIPKKAVLAFSQVSRVEKPAFESREAYWRDAFDGAFAVRNRMNSNKADISIRQGGRMKFYNFHHSFNDLLSPGEYFDQHPEYFSLVNGVRLRDRTQLCLTNPEVLQIAIARVRQWIRENPDCRVFSVAQNDWGNYCTCPACAALDAREGSPAGTMIAFVNQVAEAIHEEYPHIYLHTFAYQYTRKAPRTIRPHPNVIVRLCSIECCFSHPLDGTHAAPLAPQEKQPQGVQCGGPDSNAFLRDLREWSAICNHLYIWDYTTQFHNYLQPMPNFDALCRNLRLFRDMGVKGVLEQGNFSHGGGGHLAELEAYLQAKLLWNPDCDMQAHMMDFLNGYYGEAAAPLVFAYIEGWQQAVRPWHMRICDSAHAPYITEELLEKSVNLLGEALRLTSDARQRARLSRLCASMDFLLISRLPLGTPGRNAMIDRFGWALREAGIDEIHERWTLEDALAQMKAADDERMQKRSLANDYKM